MTRRRDAILREMGLAPLWRLRGVAEAPAVEAPPPAVPIEAPPARPPVAASAPARRPVPLVAEAPALPAAPPPRVAPAADLASLGWDALEARILGCEGCVLCQRRKRAVPGVGDRQADWLFVGEGPGAEEDERGEPFVGQAGRLLDAMLAAMTVSASGWAATAHSPAAPASTSVSSPAPRSAARSCSADGSSATTA